MQAFFMFIMLLVTSALTFTGRGRVICRELTQILNLWETKKIEKTHVKKSNHTHKTIFTWFGNLLTSMELQGFHYYQEKIQKCGYSFSSHTKNTTTPKNPNNQITFSTQNGPKKFFSQHYSGWIGSSTGSNTTKHHKAQHNID